jgi:hypothetical protein
MASTVASGAGYLPNIYQNDDWRTITVHKLNSEGQRCEKEKKPQEFKYTMEVSTGDLYGLKGDPDPRYIISLKAVAVFAFTSLWLVGIMTANLIKIAIDVSSIFWKVIPQMLHELYSKGIVSALGNAIMATVYEIPKEICFDIWRICRSPFFALGMEFASLYAIFSPYEGRKWIGKVESIWRDETPYKLNVNNLDGKKIDKDPFHLFKEIAKGKILFMAICMQKMGNIHDKVGNKNKYEIV